MISVSPIAPKTHASMDIEDVWLNYKDDLADVEKVIHQNLASDVALIHDVGRYTLSGGGKRIRPLLVVISAQMGPVPDKRYFQLGSVVEFIHTATLLHDDVLDNAKNRRGQLAARNLYGNHASILTGDFLYTQAICQIVAMESVEMNYLLSTTCSQMTEGEAWQLAHTQDVDITEALYLKIIERKTAALFAAACTLGGILSGVSPEEKEALTRFGRNLGMAFQIADDTLDYMANSKRLGKSQGQDLAEGKITLPLIHLLAHCSLAEKDQLVALIRGRKSHKSYLAVLALMKQYGSLVYAQDQALRFVEDAKNELDRFCDSPHRQALLTIADYVLARNH